MGEGREIIRKFLLILQTYKSSGCLERAAKFYAHYSTVEGDFMKIRDIVIANKKPRRLELNSNLVRYNEKTIAHNNYHECLEGVIHSFADRYPFNKDLYQQVMNEWEPTASMLRVEQEEKKE
jgi:dipeptidyl-peptidase III